MDNKDPQTLAALDEILKECDGSVTEIARRLTVENKSKEYYTINQVRDWYIRGTVPLKHVANVAQVFNKKLTDIAPDLRNYERN